MAALTTFEVLGVGTGGTPLRSGVESGGVTLAGAGGSITPGWEAAESFDSTTGSAVLNPKASSNSDWVNPLRTREVPSSFSTLVTGVPAKLSLIASISVRNSLLVSKFLSSNWSWWAVR